jgi:hypothetical protein
MTKTNHYQRRASERGIDEVSLSILSLFGEHLDKRQGLVLSRRTYQDLKNIALETKQNELRQTTVTR